MLMTSQSLETTGTGRAAAIFGDGACGTDRGLLAALERVASRGGSCAQQIASMPCSDWLNLLDPEAVRSMHGAYVAAGSRLILTNTFRCSSCLDPVLPAVRLLEAGVRLAREVADASGETVSVGCRIGSGMPACKVADLAGAMSASIQVAEAVGADVVLVETVYDARCLDAALKAAGTVACRIPVVISAVPSSDGRSTLWGMSLADFVRRLAAHGVAGCGLNCAPPAEGLHDAVSCLRSTVAGLPQAMSVWCYPNAGMPVRVGREMRYPCSPSDFAAFFRPLTASGTVDVAGGCCGISPGFISSIANCL